MNLPIGTLLQGGKYRIERLLGQGGFGITYLATNIPLRTKVAIKEYFIGRINSRANDHKGVVVSIEQNRYGFESQRNKFRKEAQRLQTLGGEHIVKVFDYFDENNTSYYTMEYVEGCTLDQWVRQRGGRLNEYEAKNVLSQALDALKVMHQQHLWHLDIKPNNIMRQNNGSIKLIDFGASKLIDPSRNTLLTSSALVYTPGYAPLEQMAYDFSSFGPWTDYYALGATIYTLITGYNPPSANQIMSNGSSALQFPMNISQRMRNLIEWMMRPNHLDRPRNVDAIQQYLNVTQPHTNQAQSSVKYKPQPPEKGNTQWGWILALLLGLGIFFIAIRNCSGESENNTTSVDSTELEIIQRIEDAASVQDTVSSYRINNNDIFDTQEAELFLSDFYKSYTAYNLSNQNLNAQSLLKSSSTDFFYKRYLNAGRGEYGEPYDILTGENAMCYEFRYNGINQIGNNKFTVRLTYSCDGDDRENLSAIEVEVVKQNGHYLINKTNL